MWQNSMNPGEYEAIHFSANLVGEKEYTAEYSAVNEKGERYLSEPVTLPQV